MDVSIGSKDNPKIKQAARLLREPGERRAQGRFVTEGVKVSLEALACGLRLDELFYTPASQERYPDQVNRLRDACRQSFAISEELAAKLSTAVTPQGVFCVASLLPVYSGREEIRPDGLYLVLDGISDPGNLGTLIRTAEAIGFSGVVLSRDSCDVYNPKVVRAAMGSLFRMPVFEWSDLAGELSRAREEGMQVFVSTPKNYAFSICTVDIRPGLFIIIGNEANGAKPALLDAFDNVTIPMEGRAESLNAAAAAAILMWEISRKARGQA